MGNPPYDNSDLPYCITDHLEGSSPAEKVLSQHPSDHPCRTGLSCTGFVSYYGIDPV